MYWTNFLIPANVVQCYVTRSDTEALQQAVKSIRPENTIRRLASSMKHHERPLLNTAASIIQLREGKSIGVCLNKDHLGFTKNEVVISESCC